jgi:hypothetical protein
MKQHQSPVDLDTCIAILLLRFIGCSQDEIAELLHRGKVLVVSTERWLKEELTSDKVGAIFRSIRLDRVRDLYLMNLNIADEKKSRLFKVKKADLLRRFRPDDHTKKNRIHSQPTQNKNGHPLEKDVSTSLSEDLALKHDIKIFNESDAILNEDAITNMVARLESDLSIKEDQRYQVLHYYLFFRYVYGKWKLTNKYIDSQIQLHFEEFLSSLERLDKFEYFDYESDHRLILWPYYEDTPTDAELRSIPTIDDDSIDKIRNGYVRTYLAKLHPRYKKYKKELLDIARTMAKDYETYRTTVRDKLIQ